MTKHAALECTSEQFDSVHHAVDQTRARAETVRVPKAALEALLRDHAKLIGIHRQDLGGFL